MKIIALSILLIICMILLIKEAEKLRAPKPKSVSEPPSNTVKAAPVFGVKVTNFSDDYYQIVFTNDDFKTEHEIENVMNFTMFGNLEDVRVTTYINNKYEETVEYAKQFTSFEKCLQHNEEVRDKVKALLEYYKEHPPVNRYPKSPPKPRVSTIVVSDKKL